MTDTRPFHNQATQAERKAVLENDTYHARTLNQPDDAGCRYTKLTPTNVTGTASAQVPQQPPNSFWAKSLDEVSGPEPPLGFDVNAQEPTGTPVEVAKSEEK